MFKRWLNRYRRALFAFAVLVCVITAGLAQHDVAQAANEAVRRLGDAFHAGWLQISDGSSNYVTIKQQALSADWTLTLPTSDGTNGQVLTTNGAGTSTSWTSVSGFGVTTFNDKAIPYASATDTFSFDETNFRWDDASNANVLTLGAGTSPGNLHLLEGSGGGTNYVDIKAAAALGSNPVFTFPTVAYTGLTALPSYTQYQTVSSAGAVGTKPAQQVIGTLITPSTVVGNAGATAFTLTGGSNEGSDTFAANAIRVGEHIRIRAGGYLTSDNDGSETCTILFKIGSKTIYTTGALNLAQASYTTMPWTIDVSLTGLTAGGTGTVDAIGTFTYMTTATAAATLPIHASITSFDTTATEQFTATVTWANGDLSPDVAACTSCQISTNNYD